MRFKSFKVRDIRLDEVHSMSFGAEHFKEAGLPLSPEYGMAASEAMLLVNEWNKRNAGKDYVYWLELEEAAA